MWRRWGWLGLTYLGVAMWLTWPAIISPSTLVPGSERTDLWNSLWSFWWTTQGGILDSVARSTMLLDHPSGGELMVPDLLGVVPMALLMQVMPLSAAYTVLILMRITMAGVLAHAFAEDWLNAVGLKVPYWGGAAWIAGLGYATAPIMVSAVHNGASEATTGAWLVWSTWMVWRACRMGGWRRLLIAVVSLFFAALANWYGAALAFVFAGALACVGTGRTTAMPFRKRILIVALGVGLVVPVAQGFKSWSQGEDNLVLIKDSRELNLVRRTIGPVDPMVLIRGGDFRSPDYRQISRYGENFFHCGYLGWTLIGLAVLGVRNRKDGSAFLWLGGGIGLALSLGPVLVNDGSATVWLVESDSGALEPRVFPMPYFLVERIPGFDSLSLIYRLVQGPAFALSMLGAMALAGRHPKWIALAMAVLLVESRFLAPTQATTSTAEAEIAPAIVLLADQPEGAVMNFPVVGGRAYLYEQTVHGKPIAGSLNHSNNAASRKVWKAMIDHLVDEQDGQLDEEAFRQAVQQTAKRVGVRYVVVHEDEVARPDMHNEAVRVLRRTFEPLHGESVNLTDHSIPPAVEVFPLW